MKANELATVRRTSRSQAAPTAPALALLLFAAAGASACAPAQPAVTTGSPPRVFTAPRGGAVSLTGTLDRTAVMQGRDGIVRMEVAITAQDRIGRDRRSVPTDLVVVFDRSGSMSGRKMEDAKAAVRELIAQLGTHDRFALVSYASDAVVEAPLSEATPTATDAWRRTVDGLSATTNTNMSWGLDLGISELERTRRPGRAARVILVSDGLANEGDPSLEGLTRRAQRVASDGAVLSSVGIGLDFNEQLMTTLADAGTGNFYFVEAATALAGAFRGEFDSARSTVAEGAVVTVQPVPGVQLVDAAGYPVEWHGSAATIAVGSLFAGQDRRFWLTFRAPTDTLGRKGLAEVSLAYVEDDRPMRLALSQVPRVECVAEEKTYVAAIDKEAWGKSVANEEYRALQQDVAKAVKEGDRVQALARVEGYIRANVQLNSSVKSEEVAATLKDAQELKAQVGLAFTGTDQQKKQNLLGKQQWSAGQDGRRAGAKKSN